VCTLGLGLVLESCSSSLDEREAAPPVSAYLLTVEQFLENEYPVPSWISEVSQLSDDWLQVPECKTNSPDRILALDCEMVRLTYKISLETYRGSHDSA